MDTAAADSTYWDDRSRHIELAVRGQKVGATTYLYRVEISAEELAKMVEAITRGDKDDPSARPTRAIGKGMAAFLRALVAEAEKH